MATVRAQNVYKLFGRNTKNAVRDLQNGTARDELRDRGITPAVIDVSFEARPGETFVVMGLSGSGKSTLIRTLNGLLTPTSGSVFVNDEDITRMSAKQIRHMRQNTMSMVFQHFALFPHRTIRQNVAYGLRIRGVPEDTLLDRANESLALVGLAGWENHYPRQLSGGMQQRVGLARALATETDVLLMDEAFSALDPLIRRDMQDQLISLQRELAKTIVFITHDLNEAMRLGDRIAIMRAGEIVQLGTTKEILDAPADSYVAEFVQDVDRSRVLTAGAVAEQAHTVRLDEPPQQALKVMRGNELTEVFVVDFDDRLVGSVAYAEATLAAERDQGQVGASVNRGAPTAQRSTPIVELFEVAADSGAPVAVLDADHRLLGAISRAALLRALGKAHVDATAGGAAKRTGEATDA
ncbi:glycine betaine/proline transport system ATP-binding protein [Tamaricihabitans halophyticus]|uniref:Glycine betaine/proline transport system ATP-binding protein n=1 Tax=Tamaricihabitans halophyticus TaxID=1262583 RepID=A0A4R2R3D3_9PSEU|nr:glycine betaine/L-proline ABC transporter ATP-binding protein [Tamaricihabitans halophyticus]TCP57320.1 glycine betaine/proline transport system ATP-binding protein [Tamaricihabitans halophyticus]